MNQSKARQLRKEAKDIVELAEGPQQTLYVTVDPNLSDSPAFAGDSTGFKGTVQVDPTCTRSVYLDLKRRYKA